MSGYMGERRLLHHTSDLAHSCRIDFNDVLGSISFTGTKNWKSMLLEWSAYACASFGKSSSLYSPSHHSSGSRVQVPMPTAMKTLTMRSSRSARREPSTRHTIWMSTMQVGRYCRISQTSAWTRRRPSSESLFQNTTVSFALVLACQSDSA
jgi:hypothetical protein